MTDQDLLQRISSDINVVAGKPVIKGTRLSVDFILNLLAYGASFDEIIEEYQGISTQDIQACLLFASRSIASSEFMPLSTEPA
ncbi:MAG: DUF433 domain-containing protein [Cyanobacteria bacterium P01_D01_bin.36]